MNSNCRITLTLFLIVISSLLSQPAAARKSIKRPNVLFIAIDDLRPALGCYGDKAAVTPNIDRLANRGMVFNRAYCQQAVCSPSRLSLLTGRRPDTIRVWDLATHFREAIPGIVTLPQHFRNQGYHTLSIGKIYHGSGKPSKDPPSWSVKPKYDFVRDPKVRYALPKNLQGKGLKRSAIEAANVPDNAYIDGIVCDAALSALAELQAQPKPFFLAVGYRKPHLPFCAPQKYWNLYDRATIPMPVSAEHPKGAPELAIRSWVELEGYSDIPKNGQLSTDKVRELRHGYYACVSYIDALVGRLLDRLAALKLEDNTVVVLWGDHGYHLGEKENWEKFALWEDTTHVPLIIIDPRRTKPGTRCESPVSLLDLYPTLVELCGLEPPPQTLEGRSLAKRLAEPNAKTRRVAVTTQGKGNHAVRSSRYRYIRYADGGEELYDHKSDPHEWRNLVGDPSLARVKSRLAKRLPGVNAEPIQIKPKP